jgi:hypothetical protein
MIWWVETDAAGVIIRWTSTPVEGWQAVEAEVPPSDTYLHEGHLLPLPPRPGPWAVFDGTAWTDPRPAEARTAALVAEVTAALEVHVDAVARQRQYTGAVSAASYTASTNPVWAAEAAAFVAWRDALWAWALGQLAAFQSGAPVPSDINAFIASAPAIIWPEEQA